MKNYITEMNCQMLLSAKIGILNMGSIFSGSPAQFSKEMRLLHRFLSLFEAMVKFKGFWGGIRGVKGQTSPVDFGKIRSHMSHARDHINQEWIGHCDAPDVHGCEGHCRSTESAMNTATIPGPMGIPGTQT